MWVFGSNLTISLKKILNSRITVIDNFYRKGSYYNKKRLLDNDIKVIKEILDMKKS